MRGDRFALVPGSIITALALLSGPVPAQNCQATPHMTPGTHYKPVATQRIDIGQGLLVKGRILSMPDCKPVSGARVAHWQANSNGVYVDALRAWLPSDHDGTYRFRTEWPAAAVPHIHFLVSAEGFETLSTQWVGDDKAGEITFDIVLRPAAANAPP